MYPALTYRDVRAALAWAEAAFGLVPRIFGAGSEDVVHAGLVHGDGMVLVERERPDELHGSHTGRAWVYVAVDDVDAHFRRAKAAGADVLNEPQLASIAIGRVVRTAATAPATSRAMFGPSERPTRQPMTVVSADLDRAVPENRRRPRAATHATDQLRSSNDGY